MNLAPIILFTYNRASHLQKTLTWLKANKYAQESILYVYCDGAKDDATSEQIAKIQAVRDVVKCEAVVPAFREVYITERDNNLGLGNSVILGVTEVINRYGRAIVLEDDLQTSPYFLSYMNQCLDHYETRKSVFSISGLSRPHPERFYPCDYPYDVYCSLIHHPTGWATWADRWNQVDWSAKEYEIIKNQPEMIAAFRRLEYSEWEALVKQQETKQNVWSVRFSLAHFVNHAVSICPVVSYINHIGWDSEATNASASNLWNFDRLSDSEGIRFLDILYTDRRIINSWYSFSIPFPRNIFRKCINWFGRKFLHRDEFALKGKVYV